MVITFKQGIATLAIIRKDGVSISIGMSEKSLNLNRHTHSLELQAHHKGAEAAQVPVALSLVTNLLEYSFNVFKVCLPF